jgi:TolB-like protein/Tfp pilus assembly protein PilF
LLLAFAGAAIILIGLLFLFNKGKTVLASSAIESIAVLPFVNETGHADMEYLSDGMTEMLINNLSKLEKLSVKARSSVFHFKGKGLNARELGNQLAVEAILTGRIAQQGENIIVNLELVNVETGNQIWGEQYNRKTDDLLRLQSNITRDVSTKLQQKLSDTSRKRIQQQYTRNNEAYHLYLQGRYHWNKRSSEGFRRAIQYFEKAVAADPAFALAYTGLADSYSLLPIYDANAEPRNMYPLAEEAALKALSLDPNLAEAHTSLALYFDIYEWDWTAAEQHYRQAIEIDPNYPSPHQWLGEMLVTIGRFSEGLSELRRAVELDPFSRIANMALGIRLNAARKFDEAIAQLKKTLELDPNFANANYHLFQTYANKRMYKDAVAAYLKQLEVNKQSLSEIHAVKQAYINQGWSGFLRHVVSNLENKPPSDPAEIAAFYAQLQETDKALDWLEKAYEARNEGITWIKVDARFDNLRNNSRFQNLIEKVAFPD